MNKRYLAGLLAGVSLFGQTGGIMTGKALETSSIQIEMEQGTGVSMVTPLATLRYGLLPFQALPTALEMLAFDLFSTEIEEETKSEVYDEFMTLPDESTETAVPEETTPDAYEESRVVMGENLEYRAMWISYLEYSTRDFSTRESFVASMGQMFAECKLLGMNTVIVQVRPCGDALYPSEIYPWSHYLTGTQGVNPGYDPLQEMVDLAKSMDLSIEAWINPYRAKINNYAPSSFAWNNPANNSALTMTVGNGVYYNPALAEVQDMVVAGVRELVENYDLDGIHLDDYFYPTTDLSVDKAQYSASGSSLSQSDWRRENVNTLVKAIYDCIQEVNPDVVFGISPQGNNSNNYNSQYSDVNLWLSTPGYVDYITPQLYWGFDYLTVSGSTIYQFPTIAQMWSDYERHPDVDLYIGLGAYRIGTGDGGANDQSEWSTGDNLAKMIIAMGDMEDVSGYTMFRHDFLFQNASYPNLSQLEREAIIDLLP